LTDSADRDFPKRGEIYRAFAHGKEGRPVVIISPNGRNEFAHDVLVIPLSTRHRPSPTHVKLPSKQTGLPHDSTAKCEYIGPVHKSELGDRIGYRLSREILMDLEGGVMRAIGVP
jgi:mRNA-degrading endonuclease toxin of MazEF toxin-antitoxin module